MGCQKRPLATRGTSQPGLGARQCWPAVPGRPPASGPLARVSSLRGTQCSSGMASLSPASPQWGRPALPGPPGHSRPHAEIPGSGHLECSFLTRRHWAGVPLQCEPLTSVGAPGAPTIAGLGGICPLSVMTALLAPLSLQRCETITPGARPGVTVKAAWSSGSCLGIWAGHHLPTWC